MIFLYLLALVPIAIGGALWIFNHKVNLTEWIVGSVLALVTSATMHIIAARGMTDDIQTMSGQIVSARNFSAWTEYYEYAVYRTEYYTDTETYTDSKGKTRTRTVHKSRQVFDHWQPSTRYHNQHWESYSNIDTEYSIDENEYIGLRNKFNHEHPIAGKRSTSDHNSRMIAGDPNDYVLENKTGWIQPVTKLVHWTNAVKGAGPTTFSFVEVPENAPVYEWPENPNPHASNRVIGAPINTLAWDQMNAILGPKKRVNVIIINFRDKDSSIVNLQRAKWIGGKKNDLVLAYGFKDGSVTWSECFGWTESETVKSNLKSLLMTHKIDDAIIPLVMDEIIKNYKYRDFEKDFDYLDIEPRLCHYLWTIGIMLFTQIGFYVYAIYNEWTKDRPIRAY